MSLKEVINGDKLLKYRYILMILLGIIIILLIIFFGVVVKINRDKTEKNRISEQLAEQERQAEEQRILIEQEQKKKEEEERAKEKQEEEKAKGIIYLTFDDGPSSDITPQVLDILEQKNIEATFFVVHYNEKNAELVKKEVEKGHTVGLHGYSHSYAEVYSSPESCMENFKKMQDQVYETTGEKSNIIRFLGGSSNTVSKKYCEGIMTELTKRVLEEGYRYFDWNVDSEDSGQAKTKEDVYNYVTTGLKENRKNVVLMHDFSRNQKTVDALSSIIDYGLENGYVFRKITEETPMVTHKVYN